MFVLGEDLGVLKDSEVSSPIGCIWYNPEIVTFGPPTTKTCREMLKNNDYQEKKSSQTFDIPEIWVNSKKIIQQGHERLSASRRGQPLF